MTPQGDGRAGQMTWTSLFEESSLIWTLITSIFRTWKRKELDFEDMVKCTVVSEHMRGVPERHTSTAPERLERLERPAASPVGTSCRL
jgi:hypothetical protein